MADALQYREGSGSLRIDRLRNTYLAPRDHPDPERIRSELDGVARSLMAESCSRALGTLLDPTDPSVWVIESVAVDFLMDLTAVSLDQAASHWGQHLAQSVVKTMARGEDGQRVMHFPNRAAYLAYFLRNLAAGDAWGKWYYREFDSLRSLPTGSAIREALFREPQQAEAALLHLLETNGLNSVLRCLSERDRRLLLEFCALEEMSPQVVCFETVVDEWWAGRQRQPFSMLELYLRVRAGHPEYPSGEVRGAVQHVFTIEQWLQHSRLSRVFSDLQGNRLAQLLAYLPAEEQETGSWLYFQSAANPTLLKKIAEIVEREVQATPSGLLPAQGEDDARRLTSSFGGLFLLLESLVRSLDLVRLHGQAEDAHFRYLLFLCCIGKNSMDAQRDAALLLAAGLDEIPTTEALYQLQIAAGLDRDQHNLSAVDLEHFSAVAQELLPGFDLPEQLRQELALAAAVLMRSFACRLPGLGKSSAEYLWRNALSGEARITVSHGRILVQLAPRPLQIVLRMSGLHDAVFNLPWQETEVTIRLDEE